MIDTTLGTREIFITQQILTNGTSTGFTDIWLHDAGTDVDATNDKKSKTPESVVELKLKLISVQTGIGVIYAGCIGEILSSLKGSQGLYCLGLGNCP